MRALLFALLIAGVTAIGSHAQAKAGSGVTPEMRQTANDYYQKQDWANAEKSYAKILEAEDSNVGARYRHGISLLGLNRNAEALPELEKAMELSPNAIFALALARAQARAGQASKMYETLEKSLKLGGIAPESLTTEKDFAAVRNEKRFKDLINNSDLAVNPCKASPEFRQFDFWKGEWDAKNAQGLTVGSSSVQLILGQCVIFENWSTPLSSGKSFNIYDAKDKKWHQTWVDDKGTHTQYVGGIEDGKMVLIADNVVNGVANKARMTFTPLPNGDVRQFGDASSDGGKTWTPTFDFIYSRKKQ